jgi:hypothetical protein
MRIAAVLLFASLLGQAQDAGMATEWDMRQTIDSLAKQARRVKPIMDEVKPQEWISKGAPEAYINQRREAENELNYLLDSSEAFARQPERLTLALTTLFRLQSLETKVVSLAEGVRNYQNGALGDLMIAVVKENSGNRDKLRQYVTELAAAKEQEFRVADQEAQRCRAMLSKQPAPRPAAPPKKQPEPKSK